MSLINNDYVVFTQLSIPAYFRQEQPVRDQLDPRVRTHFVCETHRVTDFLPKRNVKFFSDSVGNRACRKPPGLRMGDHTIHAESCANTDLRELGGFPRTGFTGDDDYLMCAEQRPDLRNVRRDGQLSGEFDFEGSAHINHQVGYEALHLIASRILE